VALSRWWRDFHKLEAWAVVVARQCLGGLGQAAARLHKLEAWAPVMRAVVAMAAVAVREAWW